MGFKNVIVQQTGGGGAPTFVYVETPKRQDGLNIPQLRISEAERRADAISLTPRLLESTNRSDVYRIPSANFAAADTQRRSESAQFPLLQVSDTGAARRDTATMSVLYRTAGTYNFTVPNGVSAMRMEAWGAGGAGGTALVNGGGGGKGGGYARRNAQVVTTGQTLTVTVAPTATAAAGTASSVSVASGQATYSSPQRTSTATGVGTPDDSEAFCFVLPGIAGNFPTFVGFSGFPPSNANPIPYPNGIQVGDLLVLFAKLASSGAHQGENWRPTGFSKLAGNGNLDPVNNNDASVYTKIVEASDIGASFARPSVLSDGNDKYTFLAYRNTGLPLSVDVIPVSASTNMGPKSNPNPALTVYCVINSASNASAATQPSTPTGTTLRNSGGGVTFTSSFIMISDEQMTQSVSTATTFVSAAGGNVGGNGSATAGGAGATAQNGTSTGDVTFTGGNGGTGSATSGGVGGGGAGSNGNATGQTGAGELGGNGGASAAAGAIYGGGGGGATTLAAAGAGAQGAVRLTFTV